MKVLVAELLLVLLLLPHLVCQPKVAHSEKYHLQSVQRYYQSGEFIIGAILTQSAFFTHQSKFKGKSVFMENYQYLLALPFAVKEINENPKLLPNITLGFSIHGRTLAEMWTYQAALQFISPKNKFAINYKCRNGGNLLAVLEELNSSFFHQISYILVMYKFPQILYNYGTINIEDTSRFSRVVMVPKGTLQYRGILLLLQHFNWKWIAFIVAEASILEWFTQNMFPEFSKNGICFALMESFTSVYYDKDSERLMDSIAKVFYKAINTNANVSVFCGDSYTMIILKWLLTMRTVCAIHKPEGKVWILTVGMELQYMNGQTTWEIQNFHGSISLSLPTKELPGFQQFIGSRNPSNVHGDDFIRDFWIYAFNCTFLDSVEGDRSQNVCTGEEKLESLPNHIFPKSTTWQSYNIYNAVYAVAHAFHAMYSSALLKGERKKYLNFQAWKLRHFLKSVSFSNSAGENISFGCKGELFRRLDVINWVTVPNQSFYAMKVGWIDLEVPTEAALSINEDAIVWHNWFNQTRPISLCSVTCPPGYRKEKKEQEPSCCYDCILCPQGSISEKPDASQCFKCPEDQRSNRNQSVCIPKIITFLSYQEPLGIGLATCALSLSLTTSLILGVIITHRDTPIVKANNEVLTYIILSSLLLWFFSALLLIGRPEELTCFIQYYVLGIIYTMALSAILTKTITVVLAFTAIQPGSMIKKWMGKKLSSAIILSLCMIEAGICTMCAVISPSSLDFDMESSLETIVLRCNESRSLLVYCNMSYMYLQAIVCFIVAFFARKLPDIFNEAKFITLSMVMFSVVWLTFIPTNLCSNGTYTNVMEIFTILTSGGGLLAFIFFPKCYIILWKPELNNRERFKRI